MLRLRDRYDVLHHAAAIAPADGLILEFGVASGRTIRHLAKLLYPRKIYGFDSFGGLPEPWGPYPAGQFACDLPYVPGNVNLIVGLFAQTLAPFLSTHAGQVALLHLDADLYSSTRLVLEALDLRLVAGTVIIMDEFWIVQEHERRAFEEFLQVHKRHCRFEARSAEQACVVME